MLTPERKASASSIIDSRNPYAQAKAKIHKLYMKQQSSANLQTGEANGRPNFPTCSSAMQSAQSVSILSATER